MSAVDVVELVENAGAELLRVYELAHDLLPCQRTPCGERTQFVIAMAVMDDDGGKAGVAHFPLCPEHIAGFLRDQQAMTRSIEGRT